MNVQAEPMRAAPPSPAEAGCAAQGSRAEILSREQEVNREKESERRQTERAAAIDRMLKGGKTPEAIAAECGEPLEFVLSRKALKDAMRKALGRAMPPVGSSRRSGSA